MSKKSSGSTSRKPLPPPPTFDLSKIGLSPDSSPSKSLKNFNIRGDDKGANKAGGLPPPPKIDSSILETPQPSAQPPPSSLPPDSFGLPLLSSSSPSVPPAAVVSQPPPPPLQPQMASMEYQRPPLPSASPPLSANVTDNTSSLLTPPKEVEEEEANKVGGVIDESKATKPHETTENIPPLLSAPNSGTVLLHDTSAAEHGNSIPPSAASAAAGVEAAPSSGDSLTMQSFNLLSSATTAALSAAAEAAGGYAEVARREAANWSSVTAVTGAPLQDEVVEGDGKLGIGEEVVPPLPSSQTVVAQTSAPIQPIQEEQQQQHATMVKLPQEHATVVPIPPPPPPKPVKIIGGGQPHPQQLRDAIDAQHRPAPQPISTTTPKPSPTKKTKRRPKLTTTPPLTTLAPRQTQIPILLIPTASSKTLAAKNNVTLSQLFTSLGNSIAPPKSHLSSAIAPRLPPFRSANRSMALNWDQLKLIFMEANEDEGQNLYVPNFSGKTSLEFEKALYNSALIWKEDGDLGEELVQLEQKVDGLLHTSEKKEGKKVKSPISSSPPRKKYGYSELHEESFNEETHTSFQKSVAKTAEAAYTLTSPPTLPWLLRFRSTLDHTTSYHNYHDLLSNPPLCMLIASTSDGVTNETNGITTNPIDCLAELANIHHLPKPYQNGLFDPQGLRREFVLLHDEVDGPKDFDEKRSLREMQSRFGMGCCAVLRINSLRVEEQNQEESRGEEEEIWEDWTGAFWSYYDETTKEQSSQESQSTTLGPKPKKGVCLSTNDKLAIRRYIATMTTAGLLPALERRIANLNMIVSNAKKGVKNVFKSLWGRRPKDTSSTISQSMHGVVSGGGSSGGTNSGGKYSYSSHGLGSTNSNTGNAPSSPTRAALVKNEPEVRYRFDSIESQVRLLADTLFLMRDYEASLSMYKLVRDDYKHDRALLHYASVHEMMGLCYYLLDPYGNRYSREMFGALESALYSYTRAADEEVALIAASSKDGGTAGGNGARPTLAPVPTRLATRLCLVLSSTKTICNNRHMEIADLLASASSHETPLGAAVLLEQSSSHYYRANMYRKYAFHMLMAGHMFRSAEQEQHAFRCFTSALYVYHGGKWDELHSHLRSSLAAQLYSMGRMSVALQLYAKLVGTTGGGRVSVRSQQKFLSHLVEICRGYQVDALTGADRMWNTGGGKKKNGSLEEVVLVTPGAARMLEIPNMDLPRVIDATLDVSVEDAAAASVGDSAGPTFGTVSPGSESVWQDLMCSVQAELRADAAVNSAVVTANVSNSSDAPTQPDTTSMESSAPSPLPVAMPGGNTKNTIENVISEIDKEKANAAFLARSKGRSGAGSGAPAVRARMEPLTVKFSMSNPLSVQIQLSQMQLVAKLRNSETGRVCTNEGAVSIPSKVVVEGGSKPNTWVFNSSRKSFVVGDFTRTSPKKQDDDNDADKAAWVSPMDDEEGPFFVVDKTSMAMEPGTSTQMTLCICPLVTGDLEILGVRCKLFNELWVYHPFRVVGPLLQNTRMNRANRVRGESYLLKSKIEHDMPCLAVDIVPHGNPSGGGTVLQGQISTWTLRISNLGTAPASNVTLKTNAPWLNIAHTDNPTEMNNKDREIRATSHCIGPSGTLMRLPMKKVVGEDVTTDDNDVSKDVISPGQTVEVPVHVRTSGGGRQELYMLFRYELWNGDAASMVSKSSSSTSSNLRWLRKMTSVPVYPSLTLSAVLMPSYWNKKEHILSIEMTNYRSDRQTKLEINLDKICIASRYYRVQQLPGQLGESDPFHSDARQQQLHGGPTSLLQIGWQERVTMHYLIIPFDEEEAKYTLSQCHLMGENTDPVGTPLVVHVNESEITDFVCLEHAHERFKTALDAHEKELARLAAEQEEMNQPRHVAQIRRAKSSHESDKNGSSHSNMSQVASGDTSAHPSVTDDGELSSGKAELSYHPTSIMNLCPPEESSSKINVVCTWTAFGSGEVEDEVIYGQHHLRQLAVRPQTKSKGCPLTITANHNSSVEHDFQRGPMKIDVEVTVRNRLVESPVEFEFAMERQSEFEFIGAERFRWTLDGGDEIIVPLQAVISSSGIYNLQSVRLTVFVDNLQVPYLFPFQWIVKVNANSTI